MMCVGRDWGHTALAANIKNLVVIPQTEGEKNFEKFVRA